MDTNTVTPGIAAEALQQMAHSRRCCLWTPNGRIEKFLNSFDKANWKQPGAVNIFILRANNQGGKTTSLVNIAAYLAQPFRNQWLDGIDYLCSFKRPNRGRIYTTVNAAKTTYADAIPKWWEAGRYKATKGGTTISCNLWNGLNHLNFLPSAFHIMFWKR